MVDLLALDENEKAAALKALSEEIDDENGGCGWHRFGEFFDAFPEELVDDVLPRHFFRRNGHGETVGELLLEGGLLRGRLRSYMLAPPAEILLPERHRLVGVFLDAGCPLEEFGEDFDFLSALLPDGRTAAEAAFDGGCVRSPVPELLYDKRILSFRRSGTPPVAVGLALRGLLPEEKTREIALAPKYTVRGEPFAFFLARVGRLGGEESFLRRKAAPGEFSLSRSDRERLGAVLSTRDARANARRKAYCGEGPLLAEDFASEFEAVLDALSFARLPDGALSTEAALLRMETGEDAGLSLETHLAKKRLLSEAYVLRHAADELTLRAACAKEIVDQKTLQRRIRAEASRSLDAFENFLCSSHIFDSLVPRDAREEFDALLPLLGHPGQGLGYDSFRSLEAHIAEATRILNLWGDGEDVRERIEFWRGTGDRFPAGVVCRKIEEAMLAEERERSGEAFDETCEDASQGDIPPL